MIVPTMAFDDDDNLMTNEYPSLSAYLRELADESCDGVITICLESALAWAAELEAKVAEVKATLELARSLVFRAYDFGHHAGERRPGRDTSSDLASLDAQWGSMLIETRAEAEQEADCETVCGAE